MQNRKSAFIFRRDLRLEDNTGLLKALKESVQVIPVFIFDPRQKDPSKNKYFSNNAFEFLLNSIKEVDDELKLTGSRLYLFEGTSEDIISKIIRQENINAVYVNQDYTPFSLIRDSKLKKFCEANSVLFDSSSDILLNEPKTLYKTDGSPYTVFTPFYNRSLHFPVRGVQKNTLTNYFRGEFQGTIRLEDIKLTRNKNLAVKGGRKEALVQLKKAANNPNYKIDRDFPSLNKTTMLSAHHKFGTVSIRESYHALKENEALIRQLYWRDFYTHIAFNFPHVFGSSFKRKYDKIDWIKDEKNPNFMAWKEGKTGFPIVDAGMRQLNVTGYMHNRVRMIVSSFLVKDLHIDWRLGERYFAQNLVDYDPSVNNGSWQWSASTGCDAQPYFRIFNPWLQQERFDANCEYIKKWVPELTRLNSIEIHKLEKQRPLMAIDYPVPIVNHSEESKISIDYFKRI